MINMEFKSLKIVVDRIQEARRVLQARNKRIKTIKVVINILFPLKEKKLFSAGNLVTMILHFNLNQLKE